jgi:spore coat polysaccharide biosynthesis predicted glycosyltransferase SpsG
VPGAAIQVAAGFAPKRSPKVEPGLEWLMVPEALSEAIARADVAIVGGGTSLYEACAAGTPSIAVAVVRAQRPTIEGFVKAGAALDGGTLTPPAIAAPRVADLAAHLVASPARRRRMAAAGKKLVDGRGLERVARALRALVRSAERPAHG